MRNGKAIDILLIDDSMGDVELITEVLQDSKVKNNLHVVNDGVQAMEFLKQIGKYKKAIRPDLIFLDLNMPRKDGREVLKEIKSDKTLRQIPVVIMTTSEDEQDISNSYDLQANCYVTKPLDFEQFIKVVRSIENFWFTVVQLPTK
jgi:two-component system, chemotaxis family, response regulator Rcp1